jgi:conjugal transfer pilus assembly protein TraE
MKKTLQKSRLQHVIENRNGYLVLASGSIFLNILMIFYLFTLIGSERVIVLPPDVSKTFWVDGHHVSSEYLSEMGLFFAGLRLNATQGDASLQHDILLRYVHPSFYSQMKSQLIQEKERINGSHISMSFYPVNVQVDDKQWMVRIDGDLQSMIGQDPQPIQRVTYQMQFNYDSGRLLVKSFEEVKDHV